MLNLQLAVKANESKWLPNALLSLNNLNYYSKKEKYFIKAISRELSHFTNLSEKFFYLEKIVDIYDQQLYYLQFEKSAVIVNPKYFQTLETIQINLDQKLFAQKIVYVPLLGLYYQKDKQLYAISNHQILVDREEFLANKQQYLLNLTSQKAENKAIKDEFYIQFTAAEIFTKGLLPQYEGKAIYNYQASYQIKHHWWFRQNYGEILAYADGGLCEYIALNMVILYHELFISSGYYTNEEWAKYFKPGSATANSVRNGMVRPVQPWANLDDKNDYSIPVKMWRHYGKYLNFKQPKNYYDVFENFIKDKPVLQKRNIDDVFEQKSSNELFHTSNPEDFMLKYDEPVILTFATKNLSAGHAITIYGYDQKTKSFLANYGWPGQEDAQRVVPKSQLYSTPVSAGFWYAFRQKDVTNPLPLRKAFRYKGKDYTSKELEDMKVIPVVLK